MRASITLARRAFYDPILLDVMDVSCSWNVAGTGTLSCLIDRRDILELPWDTVIGKWVAWDSPAGLWGGLVETVSYHIASRYVELSCQSFHNLLRARRTTTADLPAATPGAIVSRALGETQMDDGISLDLYFIEEVGEPIAYQLRDDDLYDLVSNLAGQSGAEWRIGLREDWSTSFEFRKRLGIDRSSEVWLREGVHFLDGDFSETTNGLFNDIKAVSADEDYANSSSTIVINTDSIKTYGRRQTTRRYEGLVASSVLIPVAAHELSRISRPPAPMRVTIANIGGVYHDFQEGDTITVESGTANMIRPFRVLSRSLNSDSLLEISGSTSPNSDTVV